MVSGLKWNALYIPMLCQYYIVLTLLTRDRTTSESGASDMGEMACKIGQFSAEKLNDIHLSDLI